MFGIKIKSLILIWCSISYIFACKTDDDCWPCYECQNETRECVLVTAYTDPNLDCSPICDTRTVCSEFGHCSLTSKPTCDCDYDTQKCKKLDVIDDLMAISSDNLMVREDAWLTYKKEEITSFLKIQTILCFISVGCFINIMYIVMTRYRDMVIADNKLQ